MNVLLVLFKWKEYVLFLTKEKKKKKKRNTLKLNSFENFDVKVKAQRNLFWDFDRSAFELT